MVLPKEFELIKRYFEPLAGPEGLGLKDDAAILKPPPNRDLVISADTIVEGVHFLPTDPPDLVARKLLRVNLSDLAAMGATPLHYLLTLSVPRTTPESWFTAFAAGLAQDQAEFALTLIGGDTTSTPGPITLSATIIGHTAPGAAIRRTGARPGDELWVTGTIGDAALGLLALRGEVDDPTGYLANRYHLPRPRLGLNLAGIVSAAIDVSDGLLQDAGHLARAAGCALSLEPDCFPLSDAARAADMVGHCLTGGDDYELLLALPSQNAYSLQREFARVFIPITRVGTFTAGMPAIVVTSGNPELARLASCGWSHF